MIEHDRDSMILDCKSPLNRIYPSRKYNNEKLSGEFKALGRQTTFHEFHFPFGKMEIER